MRVSSGARNSAGSSLPPGSFGRIVNSSSATPPIESPDPAARNRKHVLQAFHRRNHLPLQKRILQSAASALELSASSHFSPLTSAWEEAILQEEDDRARDEDWKR